MATRKRGKLQNPGNSAVGYNLRKFHDPGDHAYTCLFTWLQLTMQSYTS